MSALMEIEGLAGGYGEIEIVRGVDLAVAAGEVLCIAGRNGVGKTTLMKLATGFLPAARGTVRFRGRELGALAPHARNRLGIAYAPQENVVFPTLSVRDNLTLHLGAPSLDRYEALFALFPRMAERLGQPAGTLSGGERKILSFCRALGEGAALTLLDEPSEGVQPENIARMAQAILARTAEGAGFVVVEQNLSLIEQIATRAMLIEQGRCLHRVERGETLRAEIVDHLAL